MRFVVNHFYHCIRRGAVPRINAAGLVKTLAPTQVLCDSRILAPPEVLLYNDILFGYGFRFFAAPAKFQVKASNESKDDSRQQINEHIQANVIRLITDEGNQIISRQEALHRAKIHELDLVLVQSNADPPVCKLMDFNKEMYQKQMKEKERAKIKSSSNLKTSGFKEIKFSAKTEVKDLRMKADMIKKLMDRGHRVKCVAVSLNRNSKDEEDGKEDLVHLLENLSVMIDEVAVFENEPILDKRQAFFIVRHKKFGLLKKGGPASGKKIFKTQEPLSPDLTATPSESGATVVEPTWSVSTTSHTDFDQIFDLGETAGVDPPLSGREMPKLSPEAAHTRPRAAKIETSTSPSALERPSFGIFSAPTKVAPLPSPDLHIHEKEKQRKWGVFSQDK